MKTTTGRPGVAVSVDGSGIVSQAGGLLLAETARATGLDRVLSQAMAPWRPGRAVHDPGKTLTDLAVALALGGDCLADVGILRAEPGVFGPVASDSTVSRLIDRLAAEPEQAVSAIQKARAAARARAWELGETRDVPAGPANMCPLVIDVDATLVTAHSEKEHARPTWKKTFGFHPILAYLDHGPGGTGEPLGGLLRPGNAGSNTAADHIEVTRLALDQLPDHCRGERDVLIRTDAGGGTRSFLDWLTEQGLAYSLGFPIGEQLRQAILAVPARAWTPAYDADGGMRDGAWVAELTGMCDLAGWPDGMRVIVRKERPHPGAQLAFTDIEGHRFTCLVTNTAGGQLADLELRHRRRARVEDRIRAAKDTGLANLPLHDLAQNQIWTELVALAQDLTAWTQTLALTGQARRWEPKRLRLRLFHVAGRLVRTARRHLLRLPRHRPWANDLADAFTRLHKLAAPG